MNELRRDQQKAKKNEQGQSMVLLALVLIGVLVISGLALDVGVLFARSNQFRSAVDAGTLAGVQELHDGGINTSLDLARQFLTVNGWPMGDAIDSTGIETYTRLGVPEFSLTVTWPVETYFLRLLGFEEIPITESSSAIFATLQDIETPTSFHFGSIQEGSQYIFGSEACTQGGDPVSPKESSGGTPNEFYSITEGSYLYRVRIPDSYTKDTISIELFDPSARNDVTAISAEVERADMTTATVSCSSTNTDLSCVLPTGDPYSLLGNSNPNWFLRVDDSYGNTPSACPDAPTGSTFDAGTNFNLYYLVPTSSVPERIDITDYNAIANDANGDNSWYSPAGFGSVDISVIPADEFGFKYVYLEVESTNGFSMNVFDIYASDPDHSYPTDVNLRNLEIVRNLNQARDVYLPVFAVGRMPLRAWANETIELALTPVDSRLGGGEIYASIFDADNGVTTPMVFSFQDIGTFSVSQTPTCDSGCADHWAMPQMRVGIPTNDDDGVAFFGRHLIVEYNPSSDAHTWMVSATDGRPILTR